MASKPEAISLCVLQKFICSFVHLYKCINVYFTPH